MKTITLGEAALRLPQLIEQIQAGEDFILTQQNKPVARLTGRLDTLAPREPGTAKDEILFMADDFDAPLDDFREYQE